MNFQKFYSNAEQRITDTILSLWATGDNDMQNYLRTIFNSERLLADPVFQNMFPWDPASQTFGELNGNNPFTNDFINRLNGIQNPEYRFPADRNPYKHQINSWNAALKDEKSILVTTGTGSGKTECFMLPVLQDIAINNPNGEGVNAIFLYPLNALIGSQKKRMHAWCNALGNIRYAVYNGKTREQTLNNAQLQAALPEVITRPRIRETPPQVLFTNPTMLEYMLIRDKDTTILEKSKGKLRWILLDEAHTLIGSKAAEMALLIRRVIDAFGVEIEHVRFAVTSATVGDDNDDLLKKFMADLCGINTDKIEVIRGKRILPNINQNLLPQNLLQHNALALRQTLHASACLDTSAIHEITGIQNISAQLSFMDELADIHDRDRKPVLPVRGHFFARNINGLFVCSNSACNKHHHLPNNLIGSISSIPQKQCDSCGHPLLELISCKTCGTFMMEGEVVSNVIRQKANQSNDFFQAENEDDEQDEDGFGQPAQKIIIAKQIQGKDFINDDLVAIEINNDGTLNYDTQGPLFELHNLESCPYCGDSLAHPHHFRLSAAFLNRLISDIVLEATNDANPINQGVLWNGKKYISFTDSRQGTAKISALINRDSENYWVRSQVYHLLCQQRMAAFPIQLTIERQNQLIAEIAQLRNSLNIPQPQIVLNAIQEQIDIRLGELNFIPPLVQNCRLTWNQILGNPEVNGNDFHALFYNNIGENSTTQGNNYLKALLYNEFSRRLPRDRALQNLGMVNLVYPAIDNLITPNAATILGINDQDWKCLVKIALDFVIRYQFHYFITDDVKRLASSRHKSFPIYPSDTNVVGNIKKWPVFKRHNSIQNRLSLLICAGLGFHLSDDIDNTIEDQINDLLYSLWITLRNNFLIQDGINGGYKLNLETTSAFELADKLSFCPVKKRLIDTTFRGYSPWIKGKLAAANILSFKVNENMKNIQFPIFPYPFNRDAQNNYNQAATIQWFENDTDVQILKSNGLWNSLHERIINFKPLYLAGEHSAQQKDKRLEDLEKKFDEGKINILSCSTTMEMGVDIGGISAVVMSNVPPSPANYLQRTGRAGRRNENKSLAFTICASNPIGSNVISNPSWALEHNIAPPMLSFSSKTVVQRHINAFLLGKFIQEELQGIQVQENIENVFFNTLEGQVATFSDRFIDWLEVLNVQEYRLAIERIVKNTPLMHNIIADIVIQVANSFKSISNRTIEKIDNFNENLQSILDRPNYNVNSPAYKAVNYQKAQFLHKNVLTYLSEQGFTPAGGIPTGVVEFNNVYKDELIARDTTPQLPTYHITRALSEYAPGMEIVIDGWAYQSAGITLKSFRGANAERNIIQKCNHCYSVHIVDSALGVVPTTCPTCLQENSLSGITGNGFTEIIEPAGFAVDLFENKSREIKETSDAQYVEPLLVGVEPWSDAEHPIFQYRDSIENAEILFYNFGSGNGYSVCLECGRATSTGNLNQHRRLRGGRDANNNHAECNGHENGLVKERVALVGRYKTDFFEIRLKDINCNLMNDETTLRSVGQALSKSLTTYLGIEEQEVGFGIKKYRNFSSIFLFDTAMGGAGYVSQCATYFEEICKEALGKLEQCFCTSACTKCLIDKNSQYFIDKLDRHRAIEWLNRVINNTVPENVSAILNNNPLKVMGTVKDEIVRFLNKKLLQEVWLQVSENIAEWDYHNLQLLNFLKQANCRINLFFANQPANLTTIDKLTLTRFKAWANDANVVYGNPYPNVGLEYIGRVKLVDNREFDYFSEQVSTVLDANWGNTHNNFVYKQEGIHNLPFQVLPIILGEANLFRMFANPPQGFINSDQLFDLVFDELTTEIKDRLQLAMHGKSFDIVYTDRYVINPFVSLLLLQFIKRMKDQLGFEINSVKLFFDCVDDTRGFNTYNITRPFDDIDRSNFINNISNDLGFTNTEVIVQNNLPHHRFFTFTCNDGTNIEIFSDAGIGHAWSCREYYKRVEDMYARIKLPINRPNNQKVLYYLSFN